MSDIYTDLTEIVLQISAALGRPSVWVVMVDAWLAAWQRGPQPPHSLWRPPFTAFHTIFMDGRDFPSENKPAFKEKTINLPDKFLLICHRGVLVMDACPSRSWICFCAASYMSKELTVSPQAHCWNILGSSCSQLAASCFTKHTALSSGAS